MDESKPRIYDEASEPDYIAQKQGASDSLITCARRELDVYSIIIQWEDCSKNGCSRHPCPCSSHKYSPRAPKPVHQSRCRSAG